MSDIDWSEAPEWANHAVKIINSNNASFAWIDELEIGGRIKWIYNLFAAGITNPEGLKIIESRPVIKQPWNGEGLPPVGVEAYCRLTRKNHLIVSQDLISSEEMALTVDNSGYWGSGEEYWEPAKTEDAMEIDKIANVLANNDIRINHHLDSCTFLDGAKTLYEAGIRKQEPEE